MPTPTTPAATDRQMKYIRDLIHERDTTAWTPKEQEGISLLRVHRVAYEHRWGALSAASASRLIDRLRTCPVTAPTTTPAAPVSLAAGIYHLDNQVYKVVLAVHGSGRPYARRLVRDATPGTPARWEMAPGAVSQLTPADRMSLEEAQDYGRLYGVCVRCGRTLTDTASIDAGIGPVCAGKW